MAGGIPKLTRSGSSPGTQPVSTMSSPGTLERRAAPCETITFEARRNEGNACTRSMVDSGNAGQAAQASSRKESQLGGQTFSEVIFFETEPAFTDFKKGTLASSLRTRRSVRRAWRAIEHAPRQQNCREARLGGA